MKIFVAGASGAIGQPLIAALVRHGHTVTGMSRDEAGTQKLVDMGATEGHDLARLRCEFAAFRHS